MVLLVGGFGTRLRSRVHNQPKPLAPIVNGKPFLSYQIDWLESQGVRQMYLAVHYMAERFHAYVQTLNQRAIEVHIVEEAEPLGSGGAVKNVVTLIESQRDVLVVNGDTHFSLDLRQPVKDFKKLSCRALVVTAPANEATQVGVVSLEGRRVTKFRRGEGDRDGGYVHCGLSLLRAEVLTASRGKAFSLEADLFPQLAEQRELFAYTICDGDSFFDIGTPKAYDEFCARMQATNDET